jgi:sugar lactone lactonase YvrE
MLTPQPVTPIGPWLSELGESPMWHDNALYWCDIVGCTLHRFDPATGQHQPWIFDTDVACCAAMANGHLLLARRDGLWQFDPQTEQSTRLAPAPYADTTQERFNDGKCDPQGRFWAGTYAQNGQGGLYCFTGGLLQQVRSGVNIANGLAFDGDVMYFADTPTHQVLRYRVDPATADLTDETVFARFEDKTSGSNHHYGGRPDGAAVDVEGGYWVAMYEGARVIRLDRQGNITDDIPLPVTCPTMVCFGGPDLKTLYITTARENRPALELDKQPLAGSVLSTRVEVSGLPTQLFTGVS